MTTMRRLIVEVPIAEDETVMDTLDIMEAVVMNDYFEGTFTVTHLEDVTK